MYGVYYSLNSPIKGQDPSEPFIVKRGETVKSITKNLKDDGYIRSDVFFLSLVRVSRNTRTIKSGQYNIDSGMKNIEILQILSKGIVATEKFTIPEGFTFIQIAELLDKKGISTTDQLIEACYNPDILKKYKIPFKNVEGFLFPDTYIVAVDLTANQLIEMMVEKFFENLRNIPFTQYTEEELIKTVIIASLVEKEALLDSERELVAAVFYNRLSKGKRLESCATIQYILGKTKERLLFSDLKVDSPYNTYLNSGLPPGPISNPGFKSLYAAANPADVDYLFFVSKNDGSHHFSTTYKEHLDAIDRYNHSGKVGHQIS
jgi:UPF0755 protein